MAMLPAGFTRMVFRAPEPNSAIASHFWLNNVALEGMVPYTAKNSCPFGHQATEWMFPGFAGIEKNIYFFNFL